MIESLLETFEDALRERNQVLAKRLRTGLPPDRIRRLLNRAKINGSTDPLLFVYAWKNGTDIDETLTESQASPFPKSIYMFMELEMMIVHFQGLAEGAVYHPRMVEMVGRYFPIFWDGSTGYLAVDLQKNEKSQVVLIEIEWEIPVRRAYASLEEFLIDAIRANRENEPLSCFGQ